MHTLYTTLSICLLTLMLAGTLSAQWVHTSLDSVGVNCFANSGTNLFAGTDSGVFLSTNNGAIWTAVNGGLTDTNVTALAVSGQNLFAGTGVGVFHSTNNGTSWSATGLPGNEFCGYHSIAIFGINVFVGISGNSICSAGPGVYFSTNNGIDWTQVLDLGRLTGVYTLAVVGAQIYVGTWDEGLLATSDTGMTWATKNVGLEDSSVHALAMNGSNFFAGTYSGVFLSTNNGDIWTAINACLTDSAVTCFTVSGSNVFAGTAHGVFLTTNNGTNWTEVNTDLMDSSITALTVSDSFLFAGTTSGVWKRPLSDMITDVSLIAKELPIEFMLGQNYPNPFNPTTTISYQLPKQAHVTLKIFDVLGREVATLVNGVEEPGYKSVTWNASKLSSGVYFYRVVANAIHSGHAESYTETKKLVLLR